LSLQRNEKEIGTRTVQLLRPSAGGIGLYRPSRRTVSTAALSNTLDPELLATPIPLMAPPRAMTKRTTTVPVSRWRRAAAG
jgi:hypothetical protein